MLHYKAWLDTRSGFILALLVLVFQVVALFMSYPMDPVTTFPNGALGVAADEMPRLRTNDFRGYVWLRFFSTTILVFWPFLAMRLAGTGFERAAGREYLLSLPVRRWRVIATRLSVVLAEIAVITVIPSLLLCAMAPLVGQRYPVGDALVHSAIVVIGGFGLVGLTIFVRAVINDWLAYALIGTAVVVYGVITFLVGDLNGHSVFRLLSGADYFFYEQVPWGGLALSAGLGFTLVLLSAYIIEQRDF
jgi:ABC-type transport system involved in multi-copper enzyme maturation permease subunit